MRVIEEVLATWGLGLAGFCGFIFVAHRRRPRRLSNPRDR
jgi:hypothetical protein